MQRARKGTLCPVTFVNSECQSEYPFQPSHLHSLTKVFWVCWYSLQHVLVDSLIKWTVRVLIRLDKCTVHSGPSLPPYVLTLKAPITTAADDSLFYFYFIFLRSHQFMWIICLADDSHEMSSLFSLKNKRKNFECRLLQILLGALRVKGLFSHSNICIRAIHKRVSKYVFLFLHLSVHLYVTAFSFIPIHVSELLIREYPNTCFLISPSVCLSVHHCLFSHSNTCIRAIDNRVSKYVSFLISPRKCGYSFEAEALLMSSHNIFISCRNKKKKKDQWYLVETNYLMKLKIKTSLCIHNLLKLCIFSSILEVDSVDYINWADFRLVIIVKLSPCSKIFIFLQGVFIMFFL